MKNNFEQRKNQRIEHARNQAAKNEKLSENLAKKSHDMASVIPMGQPILVGHYSEKRDRNFRKKIQDTFGKSIEADNKAQYYKEKAEAIENNTAIFSDDPQAIEKLKAQLEHLQKLQAFMKAANKCIRKKDKTAFLKMEWATEKLWQEVNTPDCFKGIGYPSYKLTNNNASIARIKQRITQLENVAKRTTKESIVAGLRIVENTEAGRVQLIFEEKPNEETRKLLKREGFRWSPTEGAWQRHLNGNGLFAAKSFLKNFTNNSI